MKKNYLKCGVALLAIASAFSAFAETKTLEFDFSKGTGEGFGGNIGQSYTGEGKAMFINKSQKTFTANDTKVHIRWSKLTSSSYILSHVSSFSFFFL